MLIPKFRYFLILAKTKRTMKLTFKILILLLTTSVFAQTSKEQNEADLPLFLHKDFYLKGNAITIGNNSLSRDKMKNHNTAEINNDRILMTYVDIDKTGATFSSSSARLSLPSTATNIKYAALYWAATYAFEKGKYKGKNKKLRVEGNNSRKQHKLNTIKIQLPGKKYQTITGQILFDGFNKEGFTANAPYVCYKDVTSLIKNAFQKNGTYTVANIKATEGVVPGGSSAGWVLYVVYEDPTQTPKNIKSYHGLSNLNKTTIDLKMSQFKTPESGTVDASITFAALEGDARLKTDSFSIFSEEKQDFVAVETSLRPGDNFFNSTISNTGKYNRSRTPRSENTLGFDLVTININALGETYLKNNQTELNCRLYTKADRFYLFFSSFSTTISNDNFAKYSSSSMVNKSSLNKAKPFATTVEDD